MSTVTGDTLRQAIAAACPLNNPRLSEVEWDDVAAALHVTLDPRPAGDTELRDAVQAMVNAKPADSAFWDAFYRARAALAATEEARDE